MTVEKTPEVTKKWHENPFIRFIGLGGIIFILNFVSGAAITGYKADTLKTDVENVEVKADKNKDDIADNDTEIAVHEERIDKLEDTQQKILDKMDDNTDRLLEAINNRNAKEDSL